jgi:alpha-ketoglutarate-dependent taurine dioxygenase
MSIEVIPTGAALGAEIRGINLAKPLDDATFAAIERA